MSDTPFIEGVEVGDLESFDTEGYSQEDALTLAQGLLLDAIPCLSTIYSGFSAGDKLAIKFAVLEMAKYIQVDHHNFVAATSPFQSETIGAYTYNKMSAAVKQKTSTGVPAFDRAVDQFASLCGVDNGGLSQVVSEIVVIPNYKQFRDEREFGDGEGHRLPFWPRSDWRQP